MIAPKPYEPDVAVPPGATIREMLEARGMTQIQLAKRMNRPPNKVNEIIQGKRSITAKTAIDLEITLGLPASFWLEREKAFVLAKARLDAVAEQAVQVPSLPDFPVAAMAKLGWIEKATTDAGKIRGLQTFFGVTSLEQLDSPLLYGTAFRKAESKDSSPFALAAWLRRGELLATAIETEPYSAVKLKNAIAKFRALTLLPPGEVKKELAALCGTFGVAFVVVPQIPKGFVGGAAYWLGEKPVIQLSCRFKKNDHFWFNFFHELGHILLHKGKSFFDDFKPDTNAMEKEADAFAQSTLIPDDSMKKLLQRNYKDAEIVRSFAKWTGIAPGVVVGRLQHDGLLGYDRLSTLKVTIAADDEQ